MRQQTLSVFRTSPGVFMSKDKNTTVRELGEYTALQVISNRMGMEWLVPWSREAQCFQLRAQPISLEIDALKYDDKGATKLEVVVIGK